MANGHDPAATLSPLKRALLALDSMKAKLEAMERSKSEPIAVVGMSCRFPAGATDPDRFWALLRDGVDAVTEIPRSRWDSAAYYDPKPDVPGKSYGRWAALLDDVERFDPQFFGIAPREAAGIDPQQRLLLELTWEAFERAGIAPDTLSGTKTGVFIGINSIDYAALQLQTCDLSQIDAYTLSGSAHSIAAGRLSYTLGLQGPSMVVDTACSSSLVAVHLACQSLRNDECRMAVAGGVHVTLSPLNSIVFSKLRMLAADGRCKTFDATADGFVEGEGCGVILLKRLSHAVADGDRILAVVRGSAVNQDGASSGLTAPNGPSQEAVIRAALRQGGVRPADVGFVEAHGTGTSLGDPIEVQAIAAVLGEGRGSDRPVVIGSVKSNIGHTQAAAGIAGLIKLVLALEREEIPPSLHFARPNAFIPWADLPVTVATERTAWQRGPSPRIGGVSSFGFSGTNVHVVLQEAPLAEAAPRTTERRINVLTVSAKSGAALRVMARRYADYLDATPGISLASFARTANAGRAHFGHRAATVVESQAEARVSLSALAEGQVAGRMVSAEIASGDAPRIAFLCTGQGAQYAGMARELYEQHEVFRAALDRCAALLGPELDRPLLAVLYPQAGDVSPIDQTAYAQPALFAVEYAVAELWKSWGVLPAAVLGHSVGEYVAACLAGVFTLEDAIRMIAARGRLMQSLPRGGAMAAVFAGEAAVQAALRLDGNVVSIAAVNGPEHVVISGSDAAVAATLRRLETDGVSFERLTVSHAFHSALMDPVLDEFERLAATVVSRTPGITLVSNVTGRPVRRELSAPGYWRRHLREPVRFADGVQALYDQGYRVFVEIGPSPTLSGMARRVLPRDVTAVPSLKRGVNDGRQVAEAVRDLYARGVEIDWSGFDGNPRGERLTLPTYPFERQRHWLAGLTTKTPPAAGSARLARSGDAHPLLGSRLSSALRDVQFECEISVDAPAFLGDHRKRGVAIFPATAYLEMGLSAAQQALGPGAHVFEELIITDPLVLGVESTTIQTVLTPDEGGGVVFHLFSRELGADGTTERWRAHGEGTVRADRTSTQAGGEALAAVRARCATPVSVAQYYDTLLRDGHEYGPAFRGVVELSVGHLEALARIELPAAVRGEAARYRIHPALLDAAVQILGAGVPEELLPNGIGTFLPVSLGQVRVHVDHVSDAWSHVLVRDLDADGFTADVRLYDGDGQVVAEIADIYHRRTTAAARAPESGVASWLHEIAWRPNDRPMEALTPAADRGTWVVCADAGDLGERLADRLAAQGARPVVAMPAGSYAATGDRVLLDTGEPEHFVRLLEHATALHGEPVEGVVHAWTASHATDAHSAGSVSAAARVACGSLLHLMQALIGGERTTVPRLCVVTRGAWAVGDTARSVAVGQAAVWGMARTFSTEHPHVGCTSVDLDPAGVDSDLDPLCRELLSPGSEDQIAFRDDRRYVPRLTPSALAGRLATSGSDPVAVEIAERGLLDRIEVRPAPRRAPGLGEIEVRVAAAGLNFRDVLNALGMYEGEPGPLGGECAGTIVAVGPGVDSLVVGDEVVGMALGGLRSYVTAAAGGFVVKPRGLGFEAAATLPVAFITADYALNRLARMAAGDRVLIHAAAGGVGLAAVRLAQRAGAEIFATAGSAEKHEFLRSLGIRHVMSSRSLDFAEQILEATGGAGVDIVLNALTGEFIDKSVAVLSPGGRFLEIGRAGIWSPEQMAAVRPDIEYHPILLRHDDLKLIQPMLRDLADAFGSDELEPLPARMFPVAQAVDAFRFMAQARHIGKIVLTFDGAGAVSRPEVVSSDATYLVTGGLGALGLRVAQWLVTAGARHLLLVGRGQPSAVARDAIRQLEESGAAVMVAQADVASEADVTRLLGVVVTGMPPLRGIVHAAGVVDDGLLLQQSWPRFERVLAPKLDGAWQLHRQTLDRELDFFVMFSSMVSIFGGPGQASYAAANASLDALAQHRHALGLPGLSINWGPWAETGMAASIGDRDHSRWREQGVSFIAPEQGLDLFGRLLAGAPPQIAVLPIDWPTLFRRFPQGGEPRLLAELVTTLRDRRAPVVTERRRLAEELDGVAPNKRRGVVLGFVHEQAVRVLGLGDGTVVDARQPLRELGFDSLMAVELRNSIAAALQRALPATLLFKHPTLDALTAFLLAEVFGAAEAAPESRRVADEPESDAAAVDTLTDEDARKLLEEELASISGSDWTREEGQA